MRKIRYFWTKFITFRIQQRIQAASEVSWRRDFHPCTPLLFDLYHYLEQNGYFWVVQDHAPGPSNQVLPGCRVRHPCYSMKLFVRECIQEFIQECCFAVLCVFVSCCWRVCVCVCDRARGRRTECVCARERQCEKARKRERERERERETEQCQMVVQWLICYRGTNICCTKTSLEPSGCRTRQPGRTWLLGPGACFGTNPKYPFCSD